MKDFLLNTSFGIGVITFVLIIIVSGLIIYLAFHYLFRAYVKDDNKKIGDFFFKFAAGLLAFILSISFANQRVNYYKVKTSIETEASKLVDVHLDLNLYDTEASHLIQKKIRDYIVYIAETGWVSFENDPFTSEPIIMCRDIYRDIIYLEIETPQHESLKPKMINNMDGAITALQAKIYSSGLDSTHLIYTSVFGLIVLMMMFSVFPPDLITVGFLALYIAFIAVVLYFISMMGNPLKGPLQLDPGPFILLKETIETQFQ